MALAKGGQVKIRFFVLSIAVLSLFNVASAEIPLSINLDFEDAQLPSAHGWQKVIGDQGSHIIVNGDAGAGGVKVLRIEGFDIFGWYLDLEGILSLQDNWFFSADILRHPVVHGANDIAIARLGSGNGGKLNIGYTGHDLQWHNMRLEMNHATNELRSY